MINKNKLKWYYSFLFDITKIYVQRFDLNNSPDVPEKSDNFRVKKFTDEYSELQKLHDIYHKGWFSPDEVKQRINNGHVCYLGCYFNEIVGFLWIGLKKVYSSDYKCNFTVSSQSIISYNGFVNPQFRGQNILPLIRLHAYKEFAQLKYKYAFGYVLAKNKSVIRSAAKFNAQRVGYGYLINMLGCYYIYSQIKDKNITIQKKEKTSRRLESAISKILKK